MLKVKINSVADFQEEEIVAEISAGEIQGKIQTQAKVCHRCNKYGHIGRYCPTNTSHQANQANTNQENNIAACAETKNESVPRYSFLC